MDTQPVPNQSDVENDVLTLLNGVAPSVREFLRGSKKDELVRQFAQRYQFDTKQTVEFEKSLIFFLLGAYTPDDFVNSLASVSITEEAIGEIVNEVDAETLTPLEDEKALPDPDEKLLPTPQALRTQPSPRPIPKVPPPDLRMAIETVKSGGTVTPTSRPVTPPPRPIQSVSRPVSQQIGVSSRPAAAPVVPQFRTMAMDVQATEHPSSPAPEAKHPTPAETVTRPEPVPVRPAAFVQPAASISPIPKSSPTEVPKAEDIQNDLKQYGIDPYREPIV